MTTTMNEHYSWTNWGFDLIADTEQHITQSRSPVGKRGSRLAPALFVMAALSPLFYVLSIGPAVWVMSNVDNALVASIVDLVYMPLQFAFDNYLEDTWFGDRLVWYSRLWKA